MKFLNDLITSHLEEGDELDRLPEDVMSKVQKNIRDGAKDLAQKWANALELVHKAYEIAEAQRPTPGLEAAWKQYETNIEYAVQQLAKHRGMDADWRMSSSMFREAMEDILEEKETFHVYANGSSSAETYTLKAKSLEDVVKGLEKNNQGLYDIKVNRSDEKSAVVTFSKWGIRKNYYLKIQHVPKI